MTETVNGVTVVTHPLVQHKLSYLRDKDTPTVHFRKLANELTLLLTYEATKDFPTESDEVETPLERTTVQRIAGKKVAVCPVLRAGLGMLDGVLSLVSSARVGFIGLYRDEDTLEAVEYFVKLPSDLERRLHLDVLGRQILRRFVGQQKRDLVHELAEVNGRSVLVAKVRELVLDERVLDLDDAACAYRRHGHCVT